MRHVCFKCVVVIYLAIVQFGCGGNVQPIKLAPAKAGAKLDYADLAAVLEKVACPQGKFDADKLASCTDRLDSQLEILGVLGPTATPELFATDNERLAYWLNARAAWSLKLAALAGSVKDKISPAQLARSFPLDGRAMTLAEIDRQLSALGGWRAAAAAPGVTYSRAALADKPFDPQTVAAGIDERLNGFIDDAQRFVIDTDSQAVRFPPVIWEHRAEIIASRHIHCDSDSLCLTTALLPYVQGSARRRLQDAMGYRCLAGHCDYRLAVREGL